MDRIVMLFSKAVDPETLRPNPNDARYTVPHTWGVYELDGAECRVAGKRFRRGNHPIRLQELKRESGKVKTIAVFSEEQLAKDLARLLNARCQE